MLYGDLLVWLGNQCRPYEGKAGVTDQLITHWTDRLVTMFGAGRGLRKKEMAEIMAEIAADFAKIEREGPAQNAGRHRGGDLCKIRAAGQQ